jgi:diguanylate cyclase (GGDEF)-like protein
MVQMTEATVSPALDTLVKVTHKAMTRAARRRGTQLRRRWLVAAAASLVALAGIVGSVLGARAVSQSAVHAKRLSFQVASREIASTLGLAIQREEDLVIAARAYAVSGGGVSARGFDLWAQAVNAMERYPELENIGLVAYVPSSRLRAFEAAVRAHPVEPLGLGTASVAPKFELLPPGPRPFYCLAVAGLARSMRSYIPAGFDYCALSTPLLASRDTGQVSYAPFFVGSRRALAIETPLFRGTGVPAGIAERRQRFVGWLGELTTPDVVLQLALRSHPATRVVFSYRAARSRVSFAAGSAPAGSQSAMIVLGNGWTVQTSGEPLPGGLLAGGLVADGEAVALLAGGVLLSVITVALVLVLATGRVRALTLVEQKTRELSHMALHDPLTDLPNRGLVMDRAAVMLARVGRRPELSAGALYLDVDGFKEVNDTYGHGAGDELLLALARRLRAVVRPQDTVGRLGGDEFVVLVEAANGERTAEHIADRVIEALRDPVMVSGGTELCVSVSVGIAVGRYATTDAMLRDADLALYAAKAAGKNRRFLYEPAGDVHAGSLR